MTETRMLIVVEEGIAFPQEDCLTVETGEAFFAQQSTCIIYKFMRNKYRKRELYKRQKTE